MPGTENRAEEPHRLAVSLRDCNQSIRVMTYGIIGPTEARGISLTKELQAGVEKPFDKIVRCHVGDGQALGQTPISFIREVMALVALPSLFSDPRFAPDVRARARAILDACHGGTVGAYSDKKGMEFVRRQVAQFIEKRDGFPSNWEDIILSSGATEGIKVLLEVMANETDGKRNGVMIPIPQYPLYSASITQFNLHPINYYLDEDNDWGLDIAELERSITEARKVCNPRVIVIINPGNPTGQVLSRQNIEDVIRFAHRERLLIIADEVYQENIYAKGSKFHSFKRVINEMGSPYNKMELSSFMSCSKGYVGECGVRGGSCETVNMDPDVRNVYIKLIESNSCPTVFGQTALYCVMNPPQPGEPSYDTFIREKEQTLRSLAERAKMVADAFNSVPGMSCNTVQGAMYAFPKINIPPKAIAKAKEAGLEPDAFYCMELLENTGMCVVPGSGFEQKPGTYHLRTTILPQHDLLADMFKKFKAFQLQFVKDYQ